MRPSSLRRATTFVLLIAACLAFAAPALAQHNTQRGATLGGLAGAVAGGLIGDHNGEAGAGAVIGGALGAVTGGLLGNATDKENELARQRAYQQHYYQQQMQVQQQSVQTQGAVSIQDVISMSRSGLGDAVIINQIHTRGIQRTPQVSDIIAMHEQGVRENVISAMQDARLAGQAAAAPPPAAATTTVVPATPVIIHEREVLPYYPVPRYYGPRHYHYHHGPRHPHYRRSYGLHIGF